LLWPGLAYAAGSLTRFVLNRAHFAFPFHGILNGWLVGRVKLIQFLRKYFLALNFCTVCNFVHKFNRGKFGHTSNSLFFGDWHARVQDLGPANFIVILRAENWIQFRSGREESEITIRKCWWHCFRPCTYCKSSKWQVFASRRPGGRPKLRVLFECEIFCPN
jgi:hypothetical protein